MRDEARDLLDWYDRHARAMPWRVPPAERARGILPDPYGVWLSEVMLQQTTVAAVRAYWLKFTGLWPTVADLARAEDADVMAAWAGLGYYARARNLLRCARTVVADHGGRFPSDRDTLLTLPGIGPYTASAVAAIAFDRPETVLDGNVERVMSRLYEIYTPLPAGKADMMRRAEGLTPTTRPGDYAQAVMDLGATICTPKSPACGICPWRDPCRARRNGTAAELPRKTPKKAKPIRRGIAYVVRRVDDAWLVETRPEKGLLGGMLGWPGTEWSADPAPAPPVQADWTTLEAAALHTFTHFHLELTIQVARVPQGANPFRGTFVPAADFDAQAMPTVMRKVWSLAAAALDDDGSPWTDATLC